MLEVMHGDSVATLSLASLTLYGLVTLVGRTVLQRARAQDSGWRGISGPVGSLQWWAGAGLAIAALGLPLCVVLGPAESVVAPWRVVVGGAGFMLGFIATVGAQLAMGRSWRIGVRAGEHTELRTSGPFRWCRNPVFAGMLATTGALILWTPSASLAWVLMWLALQLQVRVVEEPHLLDVHGDLYRQYAARTGRFIPGVGRGL